MKKIQFDELVDIASLERVQAELKHIEESLKRVISVSRQTIKTNNGNSAAEIMATKKAILEAEAAQRAKNEVEKQALKIEQEKARLTKLNTEAQKSQLALQNAQTRATRNQNDAYGVLNRTLAENQRKWLNLAASGQQNTKQAKELLAMIQKQDAALKKLDATIGRNQRNVGNYASAFRGLGSVMGAFGVGTGIYLGAQIAQDIFRNTVEIDRYNKALKQVSSSTADFNKSQGFIKELADEIGAEIFSLTDAFIKFKAATNGTNLEGEQTEKIFRSVAKSGAAMGLSAEDQAGALKALGQMISKGKIQAEELRGQLGDRLPGALQIMSRAMGISTQQLDKMMKKGELYAEEVLPLMAKEMEKTFGVDNENRISTLRSEVNRLGNTWKTMFDSGDGVEESNIAKALKYLILLTNELLKAAEYTAKALKEVFVDPFYDNFFRDFNAEKVDNMIKTGSNIVQKELKRIGEEMSKMTDEQSKIYKTSKFKWYNDIIISNNEEIKQNNIKIAQYKNLGGAWSETADKLILRNKMLAASSKSSVELLEGLNKLSVKKATYKETNEERAKRLKAEEKAISDRDKAQKEALKNLETNLKFEEELKRKRLEYVTSDMEKESLEVLRLNEELEQDILDSRKAFMEENKDLIIAVGSQQEWKHAYDLILLQQGIFNKNYIKNRKDLIKQIRDNEIESEKAMVQSGFESDMEKLLDKQKLQDLEFEIANKQGKFSQEEIDKRTIQQKKNQNLELIQLHTQYFMSNDVLNKEYHLNEIERLKKENELLGLDIKTKQINYQELLALAKQYADDKLAIEQERLDKELAANEKQQDHLRKLAEKGTKGAAENLAFEERQQAKLQARKERLEERKRVIELVNSGLNIYAAKIQKGQDGKTAYTTTVSDINALVQSLKLMGRSYFVGTDEFKGGDLDSNGGNLALLHKGERVVTAKDNAPLLQAGISNRDLTSYALLGKSVSQGNNVELLQEVKRLGAIMDNKPVLTDVELDKMNGAIIYTIEQRNKTVRNHRKLRIYEK